MTESSQNNRQAVNWQKVPKLGLLGLFLQVGIMLFAGAWLNIMIQIVTIGVLIGIGRYGMRAEGQIDPMRRYTSSLTMLIYLVAFIGMTSNAIALVTSLPIDVETNVGQLMIFSSGMIVLPTAFAVGILLEAGRWLGNHR